MFFLCIEPKTNSGDAFVILGSISSYDPPQATCAIFVTNNIYYHIYILYMLACDTHKNNNPFSKWQQEIMLPKITNASTLFVFGSMLRKNII